MKRYDLTLTESRVPEMKETSDGYFVTYADAMQREQELLQRLNAAECTCGILQQALNTELLEGAG